MVLLAACGAAAEPAPTVPDPEALALAEAAEEQEAEIQELEARLALSQAEARDLRQGSGFERETVRIERGGDSDPSIAWDEPTAERAPEPDLEPEASGPRPMLRLTGSRTPSTDTPLVLPPGFETLGGLPTTSSVPAAPPAGFPLAQAPSVAPVVSAEARAGASVYRAALASLSERRLTEAAGQLDAFLRDHPNHAYRSNALFWRGEVDYLSREYRSAIGWYSQMVDGFPRGSKLADALVKMGMCHLRLGERSEASAIFGRVRREHPNSVAARMLAPEESG